VLIMAQYLTPGVYIEEIERGPQPIEGVSTNTAAILGETERGQTMPKVVTSYSDYRRWFGDIWGNRDRYVPYAVNAFFENGGTRLYICRIARKDAVSATATNGGFTLTATGGGTWGNQVYVKIQPSTTNDKSKNPIGFHLSVAYWSVAAAAMPPFDPFNPANRKLSPQPDLVEDFDDLVVDPSSPNYFVDRVTGNSGLIGAIAFSGTGTGAPASPLTFMLANGTDGTGAVDDNDYAGDFAPQQRPQGLKALELDPYREVALLYAPYFASKQIEVSNKVIDHCERLKSRFAVIDAQPNTNDPGNLDPRSTITDTEYSAFYFPWVQISDPQNGATVFVPPGGYALGVTARVDDDRGVFKAPANEIPRGVVDLQYHVDDALHGILNPQGCNVIRNFAGRGIRIWGARTMSSDTLWKYISVRRLFIFLERSIYEGTQWVVFEPNDPRLWARVKDSVRLFLRTQWRAGALLGDTEDQAFFITCDHSTMTDDDILNGRLICEIGIAPVRPAEFVIFRIFQQTAEAQQ
jgi:hypothetical protein